jgi:hypothetical protein
MDLVCGGFISPNKDKGARALNALNALQSVADYPKG